jgi:hypothetical protein
MTKKFNIHDWQAKQRKQLLNEGVWEVGSKQDIQEFIAKLKQLKNVYYNIVGSDEVQNGLDAALKAAEELMRHAKPGMNEHHEEGTFPEVDQKTKDYLDKLEKSDPSAYKAVEDYIKAMGGMDENVTGGEASVDINNGGSPTGPYPTPNAFKKKNKED